MAVVDKNTRIGLFGLAVMGQNFALNIASKGFKISVCNRSHQKVHDCVARAKKELTGDVEGNLTGYTDLAEFVKSIAQPRSIILLVKAGKPVDAVIQKLIPLLSEGDLIIDGGNEWYTNTEARAEMVAKAGLLYMGMGVSGGEEGARFGPSLMPGGPKEAYARIEDILVKAAAQHKSGVPCVTWIGPRGAGNYVKMVHNGIEYGDMQLIAEAYDVLKRVGGLTNSELASVFGEWNKGDLESFLIEITADIFKKKDEKDESKFLVDQVLDKTGNKGTGKWTCKEAAEVGVDSSTMVAALNARYMACLKDERVSASKVISGPEIKVHGDKKKLIELVRNALYASKICSYAQGMSLIQTRGELEKWNLDLGKIASIWRGGCIIRAVFLDRITDAYNRDSGLANLLMDKGFMEEINEKQAAWREVIGLAVSNGVPVPAMASSLAYFDSYRTARLPANLTQAQRDYFGSHTYQRLDSPEWVHSQWSKL